MRALAIHTDLIVFVSGIWQTTCTAVRSGEEGFVIDSPVLPEELEALPGVLEQAGFPVSALLATHADWDHLLGRLAVPDAVLGCGERTAHRLAAEPGSPQRGLRDFDDRHYLVRNRPLALGAVQQLPVPGLLGLGEHELQLLDVPGHTADGSAFVFPWLGALVCGDYLSPVEIPLLSPGGSLTEYLAALGTLRRAVESAATVIPGHGAPMERAAALRVLDEDVAYLEALPDPLLPPGRRGPSQRRLHEQNLAALR